MGMHSCPQHALLISRSLRGLGSSKRNSGRSLISGMELAGLGALTGLVVRPEEVPGRPPRNTSISRLFATSNGYPQLLEHKTSADAAVSWMHKFGKKARSYARSLREHVRRIRGPKRGAERAFGRMFGVREGEKLLMALHCHLSTTAGPLAGTLFVSTEKIAFHSDRPLRATSPMGEVIGRIPYKVMIPMKKIKKAGPGGENVSSKPSASETTTAYIKITTVDDYDFWFMGVC